MDTNKILHKRSTVVTDGSPKLPSAEQIDYGEIAINYADGYETISIKNSSNDITVFKDKKYIDETIEESKKDTVSAVDTSSEIDDIDTLPFVKYVEQTLDDVQKEQVKINLGIVAPFDFYKSVGGILNERQYNIMVKYSYTPFMISSNSVTTIPDELLNESKNNFFADWYWSVMRITGGEPIMTTQWQNNIPYKFKGMVNGKIYTINFNNKTITPES